MRKTLFLSLLIGSLCAFECSLPQRITTLTNWNQFSETEISVNDSGSVAVAWQEKDEIKVALKNPNEDQFSIDHISGIDGNEDDLFDCFLDASGNLKVLIDGDDDLRIIEKRVGEGFGAPVVIENFSKTYYDSDGSVETFSARFASSHVSLARTIGGENETLFEYEVDSSFIPKYAKNQLGKRYLCWGRAEENAFTFYFSKQEGDSWSKPQTVTGPSWLEYSRPRLFVDEQENLHVMIRLDYNNGFLTFSRIDGEWTELELISKDEIIGPADYPNEKFDCDMDPQGNLMAVWGFSDSMLFSAYKPCGKPWLSPIALTSEGERNFSPCLRVDDQGRFVLIYTHHTSWCELSVQGILFSSEREKWSTPFQLTPAGQLYQAISFDLSPQGKGAIAVMGYEDRFGLSLNTIQFSLDSD